MHSEYEKRNVLAQETPQLKVREGWECKPVKLH